MSGAAQSSSWQRHPPSYLFLNSRLHLIMASLPPVVMAEEQEVNQRSIISQPAPGGKSAGHVTTPSLAGPLPACEPPHIEAPCSIPVGYRQCTVSLCQVTCDTALMSQCEPSCSGAHFRLCACVQRQKKQKSKMNNNNKTNSWVLWSLCSATYVLYLFIQFLL